MSPLRSALCKVFALAATTVACAGADEVKIYQHGPIRVLYNTSGPDAVDAEDRNQNGLPDQVEDAVTQIEAARLLYCRILGFPDPFQAKRYEGVVFLDVRFRLKETLQGNGKAYDEVQKSSAPGDPAGTRVLRVGVATSVRPSSNPTPLHEFFHVIQNGATYFKNRWYTEGTARWSQRPFGPDGADGAHKLESWPLTGEQSAALGAMAYDATRFFWKPLASQFDPEGVIPTSELTNQLAAMTYVNGEKVWKTDRLPGWKLIRAVLHQLDIADEVAFRELNYQTWSEENQRSPQNDRYILGAIEKAVTEIGEGAH